MLSIFLHLSICSEGLLLRSALSRLDARRVRVGADRKLSPRYCSGVTLLLLLSRTTLSTHCTRHVAGRASLRSRGNYRRSVTVAGSVHPRHVSINLLCLSDEAALYDRQIRLWGLEAQQRSVVRRPFVLVIMPPRTY